MFYAIYIDSFNQRSFICISLGYDDTSEMIFLCPKAHTKCTTYRVNTSIQPDLTCNPVILHFSLVCNLFRCHQNPQCDGKIESSPVFPKSCRRQVNHQFGPGHIIATAADGNCY